MVYIHRRHRTYTVGIGGVRDGAQTGNGSPCTRLQGEAPKTGTRCPYAILHCYTIAHATLSTAQNFMQIPIFYDFSLIVAIIIFTRIM